MISFRKRCAAEDSIKENLAVVHLPVVHVKVERTVRSEHPASLLQPRLQEGQVVVEEILESRRAQSGGRVTPSLESDPVPLIALDGPDLGPLLDLPRVERRVNVDQLGASVGQAPKNL